ncbi:hypothetical protein [Candidatus Finniella inopinata]|uniref:Uncharacterized protein n=1 Tax=Candidatus Finniella inopinata TaxID=1696036 RepID=A0A4Q7DG01_9PROT|nr:hypothetical protein [Candidatus Finniella inopinata]RZI45108.1 hypothetical protein EQU50_08205 [Candidatus Finniella inopinata]
MRNQFSVWLHKMELTYQEASQLLKVPVQTVEGYICGKTPVPPQHLMACRVLLKVRTQRLNRERRLQKRSCLSFGPVPKTKEKGGLV